MRAIKISLLIVIISVCQTSAVLCSNAYGQTEKNIPEEKIAELREGLASIEDVSSTSQMRRELKRVSRSGMSLIRRYRKAETRFEVLAIVFECQKQMFILHDSDRNRKELLVICKMLVEAPDKYADLRMPADALLMQINLDQNNAGKQQRLTELAKFADRYRDTTAEIDSLILASEVTFNLGSKKLLTVFRRTLTEQFSHDPQVIAFMKQRFSVESPFQLRGIFKDATGKQRSFPIGQTYVVCFWSEDAPILEMKFAEIKELQDKYKGEFTVISFNLDELDDAGESILRKQGLDWVAMHLPDGAESELFASTGGANMFSIKVVGPHGLTRPEYKDMSKVVTVQPVSLDRKYRDTVVEQKYFPIIRSLGAGDFLIHESTIPAKTSIPRDTLNQIQACFEVSPDRYKLKADESFKNYQQAEKLCSDAIKKHAGADDLWVVYNRHIIASMGMWRIRFPSLSISIIKSSTNESSKGSAGLPPRLST